jgi:tetratricopeptide (TPR) repeat protein
MTAELLAEDPASRPAFFLHALALQRLRDASGLGAAAEAILARLPGDPELLELTANAWLALGDLEGAARAFQRALDAGLARPAVYNNAAWLELFREPPSRAALEWARRAGAPDRADHASLNTLAAVHASFGQPQEAREVFLRSLQVAGEAPPGPADWLVHGLIAEAWGLTEAARASFAKVEPEPQDPTAPYLLARRRLAALSGAGTAALPVAPTAAPSAAPDRAGPAGSPAAPGKPGKPMKPKAPPSPSRKRAPQPPPAKTAPA